MERNVQRQKEEHRKEISANEHQRIKSKESKVESKWQYYLRQMDEEMKLLKRKLNDE